MERIITDIENIRVEQLRKYDSYKVFLIIDVFIALVLIVIGINTFNQRFSSPANLFVLVLIVIIIIAIPLVLMNKVQTRFSDYVKDQLVNRILATEFSESFYDKHARIDINTINDINLVRVPDRYTGQDYISGVYKNLKFEISSVMMEEEVKDDEGSSYSTYFKGKWLIFKFANNFKDIIKVYERSLGVRNKGLEKIETEMVVFNKKFKMFTSNPKFFYYMLNPTMIERMLELEQEHKGSIHYCFVDEYLHIGINDYSDFFKLKISEKITVDTIKLITDELTFVKAIVDKLALDSNKFNSQMI